jgi:hypothetical protein
MNALKIACAVSMLILCACAAQKFRLLLDEPPSGQPFNLPVEVTRLSIADLRNAVDNRDIIVSALAVPGRKDSIAPALSGGQRELLEKEFGKYISDHADYTARCSILIMEGVMRYASSWSGEGMSVRSKIRVVLIDSLHTPFLASAAGEADYSFQSNIANKKNFEKLYQKAMKAALFKAMESVSGVVKSIVPPK